MWAIILNFYRGTHVSLIENESYLKKPEKVLRKQKMMVNTGDNIKNLVS